jgi:hypothetical protein
MARDNIEHFQQIPNVGKATELDFVCLGFKHPRELAGRDPYLMYQDLCRLTGQRHDPCVIDVFISAVRFMEGEEAQKWWYYTAERKARLGQQ